MNEIDSISETELVKETIGDIDASVAHLFANQRQFGLSKWASLQATEKIIKAFISQKGEKYYTNSLRKEYRCIKVDDDKATIMLFDEVMGKPLEVQFVQDRKYWRQYYILPDHAHTSRLERRYQAIVEKDAASEKKDPAKSPIKVGRNDPCPCGSGKKYKKCCGN